MATRIKDICFLVSIDVVLLSLSLYLTLWIRWRVFPDLEIYRIFLLNFSWLFLIYLSFLFILDFYSFKNRPGTFAFFKFFLIFIFLAVVFGSLYFYFQPALSIAPRIILILEIIIFSVMFWFWRIFYDWLFRKTAQRERIIILGDSSEVKDLLFYLKNSLSSYKVVGVYDKEGEDSQEFKEVINREKVKKIVVSNGLQSLRKIPFFSKIEIESFAHFSEDTTGKVILSALNDARFLEDFYKEDKKSYVILKRIFDILFSLIGILVLAILFPFIAIAIKIGSRGPIIFSQKRVGKKEKIFDSYKFRSMFSSDREDMELWREKNKKEVTRIGRILRFTHIDELPQFFNILKGDMTLIGPRPEWKKLEEIYKKEIPFYFLRYQVKPGFTGWAQINFFPSRSVEEAQIKFQYDLYYIKHRSFLVDIIILLKSLRKIFG